MTTVTIQRKQVTTTAIAIRCKAFATEGVKLNHVRLFDDGTIRVWDDVAGYYTTCHSLSAAAQRRIRRLAESK